MSVDWGGSQKPQNGTPDEQKNVPAADPSGAWAQLADSFPEWTLEPPLLIAPRRPPPS